MAHLLVYVPGDIPAPILNVSIQPGNVTFTAEKIHPRQDVGRYWKIVHLPLSPGDWRNTKFTIRVTCGDVFEATEISPGFSSQHCLDEIYKETGIRPKWMRYFEDEDWVLVYVFS